MVKGMFTRASVLKGECILAEWHENWEIFLANPEVSCFTSNFLLFFYIPEHIPPYTLQYSSMHVHKAASLILLLIGAVAGIQVSWTESELRDIHRLSLGHIQPIQKNSSYCGVWQRTTKNLNRLIFLKEVTSTWIDRKNIRKRSFHSQYQSISFTQSKCIFHVGNKSFSHISKRISITNCSPNLQRSWWH